MAGQRPSWYLALEAEAFVLRHSLRSVPCDDPLCGTVLAYPRIEEICEDCVEALVAVGIAVPTAVRVVEAVAGGQLKFVLREEDAA
jgi:hypothetical protein